MFLVAAIMLVSSLTYFSFAATANTTEDLLPVENLNPNILDQQFTYDHFVVFPDTASDYQFVVNNYEVYASYDNIRVAIIKTTTVESQLLRQQVGPTFVARDVVPQLSVPTPVSSDSSLGLDSTEDADFMDVDDMWALGYTGDGVVVGITDNGVSMDHSGISSQIINQTWFETENLGIREPDHGTPVAGTIVGQPGDSLDSLGISKGNAFNAEIYSAAWRMQAGTPSYQMGEFGEHYFAAFDYLAGLNDTLNLVNFSGSGGYSIVTDLVVDRLEQANVLLVASAGNAGTEEGIQIGCPACTVGAVAVGAQQRDARGSKATFSSSGPGPIPGLKPDVIAPGVDVYTTTWSDDFGNSYGRVDGTSFSAPLTTGALAVLIEALNDNGYEWNIGTIKAALIRGAYATSTSGNGNTGDYAKGAGHVSLIESWNYINGENSGETYASGLAVTPLSDQVFRKDGKVTEFFADIATDIKGYTLITSNISDVQITIDGNLTDFLSVGDLDPSRYSQFIPLQVNTTGVAQGLYSGNVIVTLGDQTQSISLAYKVGPPAVGFVGFDLWHTDWDDFGANTLDGSNTGETVKKWLEKRYWVETFNEPITSTLLEKYDVVWMPDPLSATAFDGVDLYQHEIDALTTWVDNGGSLLVDFNGPFLSDNTVGGVNATGINALIGEFGINSYTDPALGDISTSSLTLRNASSLIGAADRVTHAGNWMSLDTSALGAGETVEYYTGTADKTTLATFDKQGGGRVMVASTNFWMDNLGALGGYAAQGDPILVENSLDWLTETNKMATITSTVNEDEISATVFTSSGLAPDVKRETQTGLAELPISVTDNGDGTFSFTYDPEGDGRHVIVASNGDEYVRFEYALDLLSPSITAISHENFSRFTGDEFVIPLKFGVVDTISKINLNLIDVYINGIEIIANNNTVARQYNDGVLSLNLIATDLADAIYNVTIVASDGLNAPTKLAFFFSVGDVEFPASLTDPGATTTETTTTTVVNSTSTDDGSDSTDEPSPISIVPTITFFVVVGFASIVLRRRK